MHRYLARLAKRIAKRTMVNIRRSGRHLPDTIAVAPPPGAEGAGGSGSGEVFSVLHKHIMAEALSEDAKFDAVVKLEYALREFRRKRGDIITIVSESVPITAIQCYVMLHTTDTQIMTILVLLFSSTVFGAKMAGLGSYRVTRQNCEAAEAEFLRCFRVDVGEDASANDEVSEAVANGKTNDDAAGGGGVASGSVQTTSDCGRGANKNNNATAGGWSRTISKRGSLYKYFFDSTAAAHAQDKVYSTTPTAAAIEASLVTTTPVCLSLAPHAAQPPSLPTRDGSSGGGGSSSGGGGGEADTMSDLEVYDMLNELERSNDPSPAPAPTLRLLVQQ